MVSVLACAQGALFLAAGAVAKAQLPTIPSDVTTPVQQRIAVAGPNSKHYLLRQNSYRRRPKPNPPLTI
jgi:hypothetical protein